MEFLWFYNGSVAGFLLRFSCYSLLHVVFEIFVEEIGIGEFDSLNERWLFMYTVKVQGLHLVWLSGSTYRVARLPV